MRAIAGLAVRSWGSVRGLSLDLHPGLNLLLGDSGVGKTLALRLLHAADSPPVEREDLLRAAGPPGAASGKATVSWGGGTYALAGAGAPIPEVADRGGLLLPVEWPLARDLGAAPGPWPAALRAAMGVAPLPRQALVPVRPLMDLVGDLLGGETTGAGEELALRGERRHETRIEELGEGSRRLAILHGLLRNGGLGGGRFLCWDLPETALPLGALHGIAKLLVALVTQGAQVVAATHSYVLSREISLLAEDDAAVRYHVLGAEEGGASVQAVERYELVSPNPALEAHARLYDRSVRRALRGD